MWTPEQENKSFSQKNDISHTTSHVATKSKSSHEVKPGCMGDAWCFFLFIPGWHESTYLRNTNYMFNTNKKAKICIHKDKTTSCISKRSNQRIYIYIIIWGAVNVFYICLDLSSMKLNGYRFFWACRFTVCSTIRHHPWLSSCGEMHYKGCSRRHNMQCRPACHQVFVALPASSRRQQAMVKKYDWMLR